MRSKSDMAFRAFRAEYPEKPCNAALIANADELIQMREEDGLRVWVDGPSTATRCGVPLIEPKPEDADLWVVRREDVVHARENSDFGKTLATGRVKHSNLTGGADAHCGGELLVLDVGVIAITGASGRYGPSSEAEMAAVAQAFRASGYAVWSYGYSDETGTPWKFGDRDPEWVS